MKPARVLTLVAVAWLGFVFLRLCGLIVLSWWIVLFLVWVIAGLMVLVFVFASGCYFYFRVRVLWANRRIRFRRDVDWWELEDLRARDARLIALTRGRYQAPIRTKTEQPPEV